MLTVSWNASDWQDVRLTYKEIAEKREDGSLPFGQVPVLEVDGQTYSQSKAILCYVGRQSGLYTDDLMVETNQILEALTDITNVLRPAWYGAVLGRSPVSGQPLLPLSSTQRDEVLHLLNTEVLPARFDQLEQLLKRMSAGPYACGAHLTIADLSLYVFAEELRDGSGVPPGISCTLLDNCPRILALARHVSTHPKVAEWNRRH